VLEVTPLQTGGDWAWVPGVAWGSDGKVLYTVNHTSPEDSQLFHLTAIPLDVSAPIELAQEAGMFAYPSVSPSETLQNGEMDYKVAYLRAIFPRQSDTSTYRLVVMDRDGSNQNVLFPHGNLIKPQQVAWSPALANSGNTVAVCIRATR
jgi:hypothetical protein